MKESPELAMAIAAEHLIQVFYTHGSKLEQSEVATDVSKYLKNIPTFYTDLILTCQDLLTEV